MTKPRAGVDHTAIVSLATAVVGVLAWPFVDGWVLLLVATLSLVLGFLALSRVKRYRHSGPMARMAQPVSEPCSMRSS